MDSREESAKHSTELTSPFKKIWWLASYPKSGNTWVRFFLDTYVTNRPIDINNREYRFIKGENSVIYYQPTLCYPITRMPSNTYVFIKDAAMLNAMAMGHRKDIALKTHDGNYTVFNNRLINPFFSKGAVYIIRDPRDVCISWSHHAGVDIDKSIDHLTNSSGSLYDEDTNIPDVLRSWSEHVFSWINCEDINIKLVRYEDLIYYPQEYFKVVLEGFGLEFDQEKFDFAIEQSSFENLKKQEKENGFVEKKQGDSFFRQGRVGQWMNVLNKEQVKRIEESLGDVMEPLGYDLFETKIEDLIKV